MMYKMLKLPPLETLKAEYYKPCYCGKVILESCMVEVEYAPDQPRGTKYISYDLNTCECLQYKEIYISENTTRGCIEGKFLRTHPGKLLHIHDTEEKCRNKILEQYNNTILEIERIAANLLFEDNFEDDFENDFEFYVNRFYDKHLNHTLTYKTGLIIKKELINRREISSAYEEFKADCNAFNYLLKITDTSRDHKTILTFNEFLETDYTDYLPQYFQKTQLVYTIFPYGKRTIVSRNVVTQN